MDDFEGSTAGGGGGEGASGRGIAKQIKSVNNRV